MLRANTQHRQGRLTRGAAYAAAVARPTGRCSRRRPGREHSEAPLPVMYAQGNGKAQYTFIQAKTVLNYMAMLPAWTEPRPRRFLIRTEALPGLPQTLPRTDSAPD